MELPSVRHGSRARSSLSSGYKAGMRRVQGAEEALGRLPGLGDMAEFVENTSFFGPAGGRSWRLWLATLRLIHKE